MTDAEIAALIEAVRDAGRSAIMPRFRALDDDMIASKSRADDLVTLADQEAEAQITAAIRKILPEATIVGEEAAEDNPALLDCVDRDPCVAIIDPVDGTWQFTHGVPAFGTILAITQNGETVFGLIYDPVMDQWIAAEKGGGAWTGPDRTPIWQAPSDPGPTGAVPIHIYDPITKARLWPALADLGRVNHAVCSAYEYRLVAQRSIGFCLSASMKPWDHAAGSLVVTEGGGTSALLDGRAYRPGRYEGLLLTAASEEIFETVRSKIAPAFA